MIKLTNDYAIDFDSLNIILYKRVNKGSNNYKKFEDKFYKAMYYYADFETLTTSLANNYILDNGEQYNDLKDIISSINLFKKEITTNLNKLNIDLGTIKK